MPIFYDCRRYRKGKWRITFSNIFEPATFLSDTNKPNHVLWSCSRPEPSMCSDWILRHGSRYLDPAYPVWWTFFRLFIRSTQIIFFFFVSTRAEQVAIFPLPRTVATPVLYMFISGWERYTCPFIYSYVGSFFSGRYSSAPTSVDTCWEDALFQIVMYNETEKAQT